MPQILAPTKSRIHQMQEKFLSFTPLSEDLALYGITSEYKLFTINSSGEIAYIIEGDESPQPYSKKDKEEIIDIIVKGEERLGKKVSRSEVKKSRNFPKYKPIYGVITKDDRGNIYAIKDMTVSKGVQILYFVDMFNKEGYFLYKVKTQKYPHFIKNGYIYNAKIDQESGYTKIKRYKIKNWDKLKEYNPEEH